MNSNGTTIRSRLMHVIFFPKLYIPLPPYLCSLPSPPLTQKPTSFSISDQTANLLPQLRPNAAIDGGNELLEISSGRLFMQPPCRIPPPFNLILLQSRLQFCTPQTPDRHPSSMADKLFSNGKILPTHINIWQRHRTHSHSTGTTTISTTTTSKSTSVHSSSSLYSSP